MADDSEEEEPDGAGEEGEEGEEGEGPLELTREHVAAGLSGVAPVGATVAYTRLGLGALGLTGLGALPACGAHVRVLDLSANRLEAIDVLGELPALLSLDVSDNRLASLDGATSRLRHLQVLRAASNRLAAPPAAPPEGVPSVLFELDLSSNPLATADGLERFVALRTLALKGAGLGALGALGGLRALATLELSENGLEEVAALRPLGGLPALRELRLEGNPVLDADEFKNELLLLCPALRELDGEEVAWEEKEAALEFEAERKAAAAEAEAEARAAAEAEAAAAAGGGEEAEGGEE